MIINIGHQDRNEDSTTWVPINEIKFPIKNVKELELQLRNLGEGGIVL